MLFMFSVLDHLNAFLSLCVRLYLSPLSLVSCLLRVNSAWKLGVKESVPTLESGIRSCAAICLCTHVFVIVRISQLCILIIWIYLCYFWFFPWLSFMLIAHQSSVKASCEGGCPNRRAIWGIAQQLVLCTRVLIVKISPFLYEKVYID